MSPAVLPRPPSNVGSYACMVCDWQWEVILNPCIYIWCGQIGMFRSHVCLSSLWSVHLFWVFFPSSPFRLEPFHCKKVWEILPSCAQCYSRHNVIKLARALGCARIERNRGLSRGVNSSVWWNCLGQNEINTPNKEGCKDESGIFSIKRITAVRTLNCR